MVAPEIGGQTRSTVNPFFSPTCPEEGNLGGGNSKIFGVFTPIPGAMIPNLTCTYFQIGLVQPPPRNTPWKVRFLNEVCSLPGICGFSYSPPWFDAPPLEDINRRCLPTSGHGGGARGGSWLGRSEDQPKGFLAIFFFRFGMFKKGENVLPRWLKREEILHSWNMLGNLRGLNSCWGNVISRLTILDAVQVV